MSEGGNSMRGKKLSALLMAATIIVGSMGMSSPVQAAEDSNEGILPASTYTMTVPGDFTFSNPYYGYIGDLIISQFNCPELKKINVTVSSEDGFNLVNQDTNEKIGYDVGFAVFGELQQSVDFCAEYLQERDVSIQVYAPLNDFGGKSQGKYTDTITFTAKMQEADTIPKNLYFLLDDHLYEADCEGKKLYKSKEVCSDLNNTAVETTKLSGSVYWDVMGENKVCCSFMSSEFESEPELVINFKAGTFYINSGSDLQGDIIKCVTNYSVYEESQMVTLKKISKPTEDSSDNEKMP